MDLLTAMTRASTAIKSGDRKKVFDWNTAAILIAESNPKIAEAGLKGDWDYTGGVIFKDGDPVLGSYTYLQSVWATPALYMDGEYIDCWVYSDGFGWDSDTKWPESALKILSEAKQ